MAKDLNLSSSDYSLVVLIFFVGYLLSDMIFIFLIIIFFFFFNFDLSFPYSLSGYIALIQTFIIEIY